MFRPTLVIAALLALLVLPATAQAVWKIDRATAIAEIVWNNPCPDGAPVHWQNVRDVYPAATITAFSAPRSWAREGICEVGFDSAFEEKWGFGWTEFCSRMIHEYGHIAGVGHSDSNKSVMRKSYNDGTPDRRCRKRGRPYLERHGLL
jgi:hypothetical protein